jgi:2-oxoglutarate ferredoxin oxidoreductase subunit alpha
MADRFRYPEKPFSRGKVLTAEDLKRLGGFARYDDVDGDGVCYRTLPGTGHPAAAYFTRGTGHNEKAQYSEREGDWTRNMERLKKKFHKARRMVPAPLVDVAQGAKFGFIAVGTSDYAVEESRVQLREEFGIEASYLRIRAFPFNRDLTEFVQKHEYVYIVDQNRDGQLRHLILQDVPPELAARLRSIRYFGGMPLDARTVTDAVLEQEGL